MNFEPRYRYSTPDTVWGFFGWSAEEVAKGDFNPKMYNSFTVSNQVRKATQIQDAYGVEGVPSMGVAGRYYTDGTMAGSMQNVLQVVDQLAAQARKGA